MTVERVTYRPEGKRARTIYLENVRESALMGQPTVTGREVMADGDHVFTGPTGEAVERLHVIDASLIVRRVPVVMNLSYGEYENEE